MPVAACHVPEEGRFPRGHPYRHAVAAVATRHRKTRPMARVLGGPGGLRLRTVDVDTDAYGTFTGDVPRRGTPVETALAKARAGLDRSGRRLGLASEGAFAPHPVAGIVTLQLEVVALVDDGTGLQVVGRASDLAPWARRHVLHPADLDAPGAWLARNMADDGQRWVVRPSDPRGEAPGAGIAKGLRGAAEVVVAARRAAACSASGEVVVESDLRAHVCPRRLPVLVRAAADLAARLARRCDVCGSPGFGRDRVLTGAPCGWCRRPTEVPTASVDRCPACGHEVTTVLADGEWADPGRCGYCNP